MKEFLKKILARDSTLITRRDDLIQILDEEVPNNLRRNYAALRKALTLNVGEIFAVGDAPLDEKIQKTRQLLKNSGMQETRIEEIINTFVTALDLKETPAEEHEEFGRFIPSSDQPVVPLKKAKKNISTNSLPQTSEATEISATAESVETDKSEETETSALVETPAQNGSFVQEYLSKKSQMPAQTQTTDYEPEEEIEFLPRNVSGGYTNFENYPDENLDKIFTSKGRLNRWRYFTKGLKLFALSFIGGLLTAVPLIGLVGFIMIFAATLGGILVSIRRLHDLNQSGWFLLIALIPYVDIIFSLYLTFAKGTVGTNKYGRDPLTH